MPSSVVYSFTLEGLAGSGIAPWTSTVPLTPAALGAGGAPTSRQGQNDARESGH